MRPEKLPSWADDDDSSKVVEPSDTKKLQGWIYKERVPFQFWNWVLRHFVKWIAHLDSATNHFDPHEATFPNMTVVVNAGRLQTGVVLTEVAEQATPTIIAPTTNPRIDRVVIDRITGVISVIDGVEAASPVAPALSKGVIAIAQVLIQISSIEITNSMITDERGAIVARDTSLLSEHVVPSDTTSVDFSGLDINTHKSYRIEIEVVNAIAATVQLYAFINNDTVAANYYYQRDTSDGSASTQLRTNNATLVDMTSTNRTSCIATLHRRDGFSAVYTANLRGAGATVANESRVVSHNSNEPNVTRLTFTSSVADAIKAGSKFRLYRGDM